MLRRRLGYYSKETFDHCFKPGNQSTAACTGLCVGLEQQLDHCHVADSAYGNA